MSKSFDESDEGASSDGSATSASLQRSTTFVWPPKRASQTAIDRASATDLTVRSVTNQPVALARAESPWVTWLRAIEQFWLPRASVPLRERLEQAGVDRDDLTAFCHRCGKAVGPFDADDTGCSQCRGVSLAWDRLIRLGSYTGVWKRAVRDVKFHQQAALGAAAGEMLANQLQASGVLDLHPEHELIVVPVPMNPWRRLARGVDHARVIASSLAHELDAPMVSLMGKRYRSEQAFLSATDRRSNLLGAMYLKGTVRRGGLKRSRHKQSRAGCTIILVDDVKTTGSTLKEACRVLKAWHAGKESGGQVPKRSKNDNKVEPEGLEGKPSLLIVGAVVAVSERGRV